jgi:phosphoglycolate phosphatase-like HAD superfamily hydrolase
MSNSMTLFLDLDGLILDVSERYYRVHAKILAGFGLNSIDKQTYWNSKRDRQPVRALLVEGGVSLDEDAYRMLWLETIESDEYLVSDRIFEGATEVLQELAREHSLVLVTLRRRELAVQDQIRNLGLERFFTAVLTAPPTSRDSWRVKRNLVDSSGLVDALSWIAGDTEVDVLAGKSLGLTTAAVLSGIRNERHLRALAPDFILPSIIDLPNVLASGKNVVCLGVNKTEENG